MPVKNKLNPASSRRRKRVDPDDSQQEASGSSALWFIAGMIAVAFICLIVGVVRKGFDWGNLWQAGSCLASGTAFVAIGFLELEWLERIIGFTDGIVSGVWYLFWSRWNGTLSESEWLGRRGATTVWLMIGFPVFIFGGLLALRIFEF